MKILVTGATGGLGAPLCERLRAQGFELVLFTRKKSPPDGLAGSGAAIVTGDLADYGRCLAAMRGVHGVIHMAALTHSNDHAAYFRVNRDGTANLVRAAEEAGLPGRFLYVGTRACGLACGAYGASKLAAEEIVRESRLDWTIVRPGEIYGAAKGEAIAKVVESVTRAPVLLVPGDGSHKLAPVALDDVLGGVAAALTSPRAAKQTYVLAGPREYSYLELLREIMRVKGVKKPVLRLPLPFLRLAALCFALSSVRRPPLVRDQIPRLICEKSSDIGPARRDLGYAPRELAQFLLADRAS